MWFVSHDTKLEELRRVPLFAQLSRKELDLLKRNADILDVPAGTELIREGESGHEFFAISQGEVEISRAGVRVAVEGAGDVFGEIALLHGIPRTATVTTTIPSRLFVLTEQAFRSQLVPSFT
jgi:trk system potassium uptake protein TrkA